MKNYLYLIPLLFILVLFAGCGSKQQRENPKKNLKKDTIIVKIDTVKIPDTTSKIIPSLSFDELLAKFRYKNIKDFTLENMIFDDMYGGEKSKFYKLTEQDAKILQIEKDFWHKTMAYSYNQRENDIMMLAFFVSSDGNYIRIATYKNKKLISIGKEVFAEIFGDIGTVVNAQTQTLNDSTFYTVYKMDHGGLFHEHKETATIINKNGEIKQNTVIISKKDYEQH